MVAVDGSGMTTNAGDSGNTCALFASVQTAIACRRRLGARGKAPRTLDSQHRRVVQYLLLEPAARGPRGGGPSVLTFVSDALPALPDPEGRIAGGGLRPARRKAGRKRSMPQFDDRGGPGRAPNRLSARR